MLKRTWALIALVYLVFAETLSLLPVSDLSLCLMEPEHNQQASEDNNQKYCPAFHVGIVATLDTLDGILERHDKSVVGGFTIVLAISTIGLWLATNKLWRSGERQIDFLKESAAAQSRDMEASIKVAADAAKAANRSARIAEESLIAADRAWISIKATVIAPLIFEQDKISIGIGLDLTNIGRSPATHVQVFAELCCDIIAARNLGEEYEKSAAYSLLDFGIVVFPGETPTKDFNRIEMPTEVFKSNIISRQEMAKADDDDLDWSWARPAIMVCARYKIAGASKMRHTIILYEIKRIDKPDLGWDGSEEKTELVLTDLAQTLLSGQTT